MTNSRLGRRWGAWAESAWFTPLCGVVAVMVFMPPIWGFRLFNVAGDALFNFWLARFYADNLVQGLFLPEVINAVNGSLNPLPVFYASMLHLPAAALALICGLPLAFWLLLWGVTWLQYAMVAYALGLAARSRLLGNLAAAVSLFSSYAFNNVFSRGALAEYVACALALTGVCALLALCLEPTRRRELLLLAAAAFALVGNIHPATAMYCVVFFWPLGLYVFWRWIRDRGGLSLLGLTALALVFSAAHFVFMVRENPEVFVATYDMFMHLVPQDNLFLRLFPVPVSFELFGPKGWEGMSIFGLMIFQINVPLLLLAGGGLWLTLRDADPKQRTPRFWVLAGLAAFCLLLALVLTVVSVKTSLIGPLFALIKKGQFGFRLITYVNIVLVMAVFFLFRLASLLPVRSQIGEQTGQSRAHDSPICAQNGAQSGAQTGPSGERLRRLAGIMLTLAALGLLAFNIQLGMGHTWRKGVLDTYFGHEQWTRARTVTDTTRVPSYFYGYADYMTFAAFAKEAQPQTGRRIALAPQSPTRLVSEAVPVEAGELLTFAVAPFRWTTLSRLDPATGEAQPYALSALTYSSSPEKPGEHALYVREPAAGTFRYQAEFTPPTLWKVLRGGFVLSMLFLLSGALWGGVRLLRRRDG